jgi:hypothetical protein
VENVENQAISPKIQSRLKGTLALPQFKISKNNQTCTQHVRVCSNLRGSSSRLHAPSLLAGEAMIENIGPNVKY